MRNVARLMATAVIVILGAGALHAADDSAFVSQSVPASIFAGELTDVSVTMRNTGTTTWTDAGAYRLGSQSPENNGNWGIARVPLPNSVPPCTADAVRCAVTFQFQISRSVLGTTAFQWRVLQENVTWFGAFTPVVNIQVLPAPTPTPTVTPTATPVSTMSTATLTPTGSASPTAIPRSTMARTATPMRLPDVALLKAGTDESLDAWCDPENSKQLRGAAFPITFLGRSRTGADAAGTLRILSTAAIGPSATWAAGADPAATFPSTPGPLGSFAVRMNADAGFGVRTLSFAGADGSGFFGPIVSCRVRVIDALPDVAVESLTVDATTSPRTVRMRIHNLSNIAEHVPWTLSIRHRNGFGQFTSNPFASSTILLDPGATEEVSASLPSFSRTPVLYSTVIGTADPLNTIGENAAERANNSRTATLRSYTAPGSTSTTTLVLDPDRARAAGATFQDNPGSGSHCYRQGVGNWQDSSWAPNRWFPSGNRDTGALFVDDCRGPAGGTADPEAYGNFDLKNGWHVVSADTPLVTVPASKRAGFNNLQLPAVGSISPKTSMHLFAGPGTSVMVGVRIFVAGPTGTDPYGGSGVVCGSGGGSAYGCSTTADCQSRFTCSPECGVCLPTGGTGTCTGSAKNCGAGCVDVNTDKENCGACGNVCSSGPFGAFECSAGSCVNTTYDRNNCGSIGNVCPAHGPVAGHCVGGHCF